MFEPFGKLLEVWFDADEFSNGFLFVEVVTDARSSVASDGLVVIHQSDVALSRGAFELTSGERNNRKDHDTNNNKDNYDAANNT